ncbi:MAG: CAP domain-containing protein [bacterium]
MSRIQKNIKPGLDQLESRQVLSSGGPSDQAQYMLELINEARTNPSAAAQRAATTDLAELSMTMDYYGESISAATSAIANAQPKQPLAWNDKLAAAATMQSQYQANSGVQTHSGPNGMDLNARMAANGYDGEVLSTENAYAFAQSVDNAMQAFLMDWGVADKGHRRNIQQTNVGKDQSFNEVGVGIISTSNKNLGPLVVTQNFARSSKNPTPKLVGVIYNDMNRNDFYTPGEGIDMVQIRAQNLTTGEVSTVNNWDSGGYQMDLSPGRYRVSARRGMKALGVQDVTVGNENVKIDFVANPDIAPTVNDSGNDTPAATPKARPGRAMNLASVNALVNSTRFDSTTIRNWSTWKARG